MSTDFQYEPVTNAAGEVVTEADLHAGLHTPAPIRFDYNGFKGFTAYFQRSLVPLPALLQLKGEAARISQNRNQSDLDEGQDLADMIEATDGLTDAQITELLGHENAQRLNSYYRRLALLNAEQEAQLMPLKIEVLAPAIVGWNVPGEAHTVENLKRNGSLALAVIPPLWSYYQNFTFGSAAAAETTPTPNTPSSATGSPSESPKDDSRTDS